MGQNVAKAVASAALSTGKAYFTRHIRERMEKRNFDGNDVKFVIDNGDYGKFPPEWDERCGHYKYSAVGPDLQGRRLMVVFMIEENASKIIFVTGLRYSKGKPV